MKEFLIFIIESLIDHPDEMRIEEQQPADGGILYILHLAQQDMGKIIGKSGKTIRSIRTLLMTRAAKENTRVYLELDQTDAPPPTTTV